jgi:hypothetical protein
MFSHNRPYGLTFRKFESVLDKISSKAACFITDFRPGDVKCREGKFADKAMPKGVEKLKGGRQPRFFHFIAWTYH